MPGGNRSRGWLCAALIGLALTVAAGAAPASASFIPAPGSPLAVGAQPYFALAQDLDDDGRVDVAAVNGSSSTVSVFLRTPVGGFAVASGSPFATGSGPSGAAVADFNGDGRADFAVSNYVSGTVSVLLGQPGGGWAQEASGAHSAPAAGGVAVADVNADNRPDLLVNDYTSAGVYVLLRQAGGGFALEGKPVTGANPRDLAVADFNADGRPDVAVTNLGDGTVTILLRQPGGGFAAEGSPIPVGTSPNDIVARDIDGDGRPDLAVVNHGSDNVSLLLRQAGGGFAPDPSSPIAVGDGPVGVAATDLNLDGRPDLVVTNHDAGTLSVLLRRAGSGYEPAVGSPIGLPAGPAGIAVADVDADGRPDLVVTSDQANVLSVLLNKIGDTDPPPHPPAPGPTPALGGAAVVGVAPAKLAMAGAGGRVPAALKRALGATDLDARLRSSAEHSRVTRQARQELTARDAAVERRLDSLVYGIPVTVRGSAGDLVAVSGALGIAGQSGKGTQITTVELAATVAQLRGPTTVVRLPVDKKAAAELQRAGIDEAAVAVTAKQLPAGQLDSLSELGETESLRLQMAMDRLSKMMETLSNVLGKTNEASTAIVQNLKRPSGARPISKAKLRRRAGVLANAANSAGRDAAALLAPVLRAHPAAAPRATFALKPCPRRCTYPRFR